MKYTLRQVLNKINYRKLFYSVLSIAAVMMVVSGYIAYTRLYLTPERRFWMAMNNSLSTPSVVRTVESGGTGNKSIDTTRFTFGAQATQDKVSNVGFKNATAESNVTTETLTTPETQFVRYLNIFSTEKKEDGSNYNFESIKNVWAKDAATTDESGADNARLTYLQPFITLIPFGNLAPDARNAVLADLKASGAYDINYANVTYQIINGQKYMNFAVKVKTKKYVVALQKYFTAAGFGTFPPLDPSGYPDNARVNSEFALNMRNNTFDAVNFNGLTEAYSNYGVTKEAVLPTNTISVDELQKRLQTAQ